MVPIPKVIQENHRDLGLTALRILPAFFLIYGHAWARLVNYSAMAPEFFDPIGIGARLTLVLVILAEFCCSFCVLVGFKTRYATLPIIAVMAVASFVAHAGEGFEQRERSLLYLASFLAVLFLGGGRWSLDRFLERS